MKRNCQTPDRNMCTPDGKTAALFVDIDGTVMECQPYFDAAENQFCTLMALNGFNRRKARKVMKDTYYGTMPDRGFEREKLGQALKEAYHKLCKLHGVRYKGDVGAICEAIGSVPFFNEPSLFPNTIPVLTRARHNFLIVAVTVGSREAQKYKIRQGGLSSVFDDIIITLEENKAALVREFMDDVGVDPHFSAFVGNSVRSDGSTLSETNFIYLPLETSLPRPGDSFPEDTGFELYRTGNWLDVEERVLNRLIRRRRNAGPSGKDPCECNDTTLD